MLLSWQISVFRLSENSTEMDNWNQKAWEDLILKVVIFCTFYFVMANVFGDISQLRVMKLQNKFHHAVLQILTNSNGVENPATNVVKLD